MTGSWNVIGGAGFVGTAITERLVAQDQRVVVVDVALPAAPAADGFLRADIRSDVPPLPPGPVVLSFGQSMPRPVRPWTLVLDNALATARLAPHLVDREVVLLSSVEVYGRAPGPLTEHTEPVLPVSTDELQEWVDRALRHAVDPVTPHRSSPLCSALADRDPGGRWVYALSKLAQEVVLETVVGRDNLTVLRLSNVLGNGQHRLLGRMVEALLDDRSCAVTSASRSFVSLEDVARVVAARPGPGIFNVAAGTVEVSWVAETVADELGVVPRLDHRPAPADDSCGVVDGSRLARVVPPLEQVEAAVRRLARLQAADPAPLFKPPLPVVVPPRPECPHEVADRTASCLWSGNLRGGRWSRALTERLSEHLGVEAPRRLLLTNSGTNALRLAVWSVARPRPGGVALCPAYTFHATSEVLRQLGWTVRLVDVDPWTWTLDPQLLADELGDPDVGVVVAVDALGNPADYELLRQVCNGAGVPLVADSAPALGAWYAGSPVGTQADSHAFSMSFAKTLTGAGGGGAVVLPDDVDLDQGPRWLRSAAILEPSAVAALDQLQVLPELVDRRERVARLYRDRFVGHAGFGVQHVRPGDRHALVHWAVRVPRTVGRDRLASALAAEGVLSKAYYEPLSDALHRPLPVTTALHREVLALPMSSELSLDEAERVVTAVSRSLRRLAGADAATSIRAGGLSASMSSA